MEKEEEKTDEKERKKIMAMGKEIKEEKNR